MLLLFHFSIADLDDDFDFNLSSLESELAYMKKVRFIFRAYDFIIGDIILGEISALKLLRLSRSVGKSGCDAKRTWPSSLLFNGKTIIELGVIFFELSAI